MNIYGMVGGGEKRKESGVFSDLWLLEGCLWCEILVSMKRSYMLLVRFLPVCTSRRYVGGL